MPSRRTLHGGPAPVLRVRERRNANRRTAEGGHPIHRVHGWSSIDRRRFQSRQIETIKQTESTPCPPTTSTVPKCLTKRSSKDAKPQKNNGKSGITGTTLTWPLCSLGIPFRTSSAARSIIAATAHSIQTTKRPTRSCHDESTVTPSRDDLANQITELNLQPLVARHLERVWVEAELSQHGGVDVGDVVAVVGGMEVTLTSSSSRHNPPPIVAPASAGLPTRCSGRNWRRLRLLEVRRTNRARR